RRLGGHALPTPGSQLVECGAPDERIRILQTNLRRGRHWTIYLSRGLSTGYFGCRKLLVLFFGEHFFQIKQDEQAVFELCNALDVLCIDPDCELGRWLDDPSLDPDHFLHGIHHETDHLVDQLNDDNPRLLIAWAA